MTDYNITVSTKDVMTGLTMTAYRTVGTILGSGFKGADHDYKATK